MTVQTETVSIVHAVSRRSVGGGATKTTHISDSIDSFMLARGGGTIL